MSFESLLVNKVTISRPTVAYTDGVSSKAYTVLSTKTKCNIQWTSAKSALNSLRKGFELKEGWNAFFKYAVNLKVDDKVEDEKGRTFIVKTDPEDVTGRKHHVEVVLAQVN